MKRNFSTLILLFLASVLSLNCQIKLPDGKAEFCKFLSLAEAEKILNEKVEMVVNSSNSSNGKTIFNCHYRAVESNKPNERGVNLFFMLEQNSVEDRAKGIYQNIWKSNKYHAGVEILKDVGDEAYFLTDHENFSFIMARKGKWTVRIKVNKLTKKTSAKELKSFAKKVLEQL